MAKKTSKSKAKTKTTKKTSKGEEELEARIALIARMVASLGKLTNVEARLRWAGDTATADTIKKRHDALRRLIDQLRGEVADEWSRDAADLQEGLRKANANVQASIRNIQKKIDIAENVTKIIGQVDRAIGVVKTLVPGVG